MLLGFVKLGYDLLLNDNFLTFEFFLRKIPVPGESRYAKTKKFHQATRDFFKTFFSESR